MFFGSAGALAFAIRRFAGQSWIERQSEHIDGLNVLAVFLFAIAAMDGVPRQVVADPLFAVELSPLSFVLTCAQIGLSMLVFWRAGFDRGLVIGLLSGFRNIGLVMATLGASLPDLAWFYFAHGAGADLSDARDLAAAGAPAGEKALTAQPLCGIQRCPLSRRMIPDGLLETGNASAHHRAVDPVRRFRQIGRRSPRD